MKKILVVCLAALMLFSMLSVGVSAKSVYRLDGLSEDYAALMKSSPYDMTLGSLSAKYESNGRPEAISDIGDAGGVSYGAYMFASKSGVPLSFAEWCVSSKAGISTGNRLKTAYKDDGNKYGNNFNKEWRAIAAEDSQAFLILQYKYVKAKFYDVMVSKLSQYYSDFNINNYTMALKNVIWSRTVQHGVNSSVLFNAINLLGGVSGHTEEELIRAMYAESAAVVSTPPNSESIMIQASSANKYGMDVSLLGGRYLRYFSRNSSDIQVSVFRRLTVNEPLDAFKMYAKYSGRTVTNTTIVPNVDIEGGYTPPRNPPGDPPTEDTSLAALITALFETAEFLFGLSVEVLGVFAALLGSSTRS